MTFVSMSLDHRQAYEISFSFVNAFIIYTANVIVI